MLSAPQMKHRYTSLQPYGEWLANSTISLKQVVHSVPERERSLPPLNLTTSPEHIITNGSPAHNASSSNGATNGAATNGAATNGAGENGAHGSGRGVDPLQLAATCGINALLQPLKVSSPPCYHTAI